MSATAKRNGNYGLVLEPGQTIEQSVYLNNSKGYVLNYWLRGEGKMELSIENLKPVEGKAENSFKLISVGKPIFKQHTLEFRTGQEYGNYMKTVKIKFSNIGKSTLIIDDLKVVKKE